eukprot:433764-Rhodomonas_salina.1
MSCEGSESHSEVSSSYLESKRSSCQRFEQSQPVGGRLGGQTQDQVAVVVAGVLHDLGFDERSDGLLVVEVDKDRSSDPLRTMDELARAGVDTHLVGDEPAANHTSQSLPECLA